MSSPASIDDTLDRVLDDAPDATQFYAQLSVTSPHMAGYLLDADTDMLSEQEQDYLLFLGIVIISHFRALGSLKSDPDPEFLGELEEGIWNAEGFASPTEVLPELEDVNAFIEEALVQDEDTAFLEEAGVHIIYAKLYTLSLAAVNENHSRH